MVVKFYVAIPGGDPSMAVFRDADGIRWTDIDHFPEVSDGSMAIQLYKLDVKTGLANRVAAYEGPIADAWETYVSGV